MKETTVVAFDLGGVLVDVDLTRTQIWLPHPLHEIKDAFFQRDHFDALVLGQIIPTTFLNQVACRLKVETSIVRKAFCAICKPKPFASTLLRALNVPFAIWSNINVLHYKYMQRLLPAFERTRYLHALSFELGMKKPNPVFFENAMKKINTKVWYFDDRDDNIQSARQLGINAERVVDCSALLHRLYQLGFLESHREI